MLSPLDKESITGPGGHPQPAHGLLRVRPFGLAYAFPVPPLYINQSKRGKVMPWNGSGRYAFTESSILFNAPAVSGVYALFNDGQWIYIGEGQNLRERLLQHRRDSHNDCVNRHSPMYFAFEQVADWLRVGRQDQLILAMAPLCNKRLG
jgi:hypothetical protein